MKFLLLTLTEGVWDRRKYETKQEFDERYCTVTQTESSIPGTFGSTV